VPALSRRTGRLGAPGPRGVAVVARGLAARGPRGTVLSGVDLDLPAGGLGVVHGPGGSGRSVLLLALGGRFRLVAGELRVGDHDAADGLAALRELSAVARIRPGIEPEEGMRVRDVVRQHGLASGGAVGDDDVAAARELVGVDAPAGAVLGDLPPVESLLLLVALAVAEHRPLILVDDIDHGLVPAERERAWDALDAVASSGVTVVASALETPAGIDHVPVALRHPGERRRATASPVDDDPTTAAPAPSGNGPSGDGPSVDRRPDEGRSSEDRTSEDHPSDDEATA
jgi:ABC-type cobalamin/Fe3+-siderophores transport system ATPase subunit